MVPLKPHPLQLGLTSACESFHTNVEITDDVAVPVAMRSAKNMIVPGYSMLSTWMATLMVALPPDGLEAVMTTA